MNYFFSACFILISKIIQLAISLARILAYFFKRTCIIYGTHTFKNKFIVDSIDIRRYQSGSKHAYIWFFILNGKMHGEILHFNNRFIYNGSNCCLSNIIL